MYQATRQHHEERQLRKLQVERAFENIYDVKSNDVTDFHLPNIPEVKEDVVDEEEVSQVHLMSIMA